MVAPVINMPSNKHSGVSGMNTQLFVQHSAESPLRGGYAQSLTKWAQTPLNQGGPEASWPSFVDPIARVRMIAWPNSAWTQGLANRIAVGLECAGYARFSAAEWLTPEGLKQLENLAHEWCYYLDLEAKAGNIIPLRWLTTAEVQKVMAGNRSIKGFCTHAQIDPASRTDPGKGFPYDRLMNRIKELRGVKTVSAASTAKKDIMATLDREDYANIAKAVWGYKNPDPKISGNRDAYSHLRVASNGVGQVLSHIGGLLKKLPGAVWGYKNLSLTNDDAYQQLADIQEAVAPAPAAPEPEEAK